MKRLTKDEYDKRLQKIKNVNIQKEYQRNLKDERNKYKKNSKLETSKLIAIYLFLLLNAIIIYAMVAMWAFVDLSYLGVLISDIAAQVVIYAIYCMKAYKAKRAEEDLRLEREKLSGTIGDILSAGASSAEYVPINGNVETFSANTIEENIVG